MATNDDRSLPGTRVLREMCIRDSPKRFRDQREACRLLACPSNLFAGLPIDIPPRGARKLQVVAMTSRKANNAPRSSRLGLSDPRGIGNSMRLLPILLTKMTFRDLEQLRFFLLTSSPCFVSGSPVSYTHLWTLVIRIIIVIRIRRGIRDARFFGPPS